MNDGPFTLDYGAWIQTSGINFGASIQFYEVSKAPEDSGFAIVTASFSTYLCSLSLITWMDHDLSYPVDCEGELWLSGGGSNDHCAPVNVTVSTELN